MRNERYSIEASDEYITIFGNITVEEAFDFINFYERKGFNTLTLGSENSTLLMIKSSIDYIQKNINKVEHEESEKMYEDFYKHECEGHIKTKQKLGFVESYLKECQEDFKIRYKELYDLYVELYKKLSILKIEKDPEFIKAMENSLGSDGVESKIKSNWKFPDLLPIPEYNPTNE